MATLVLMNIFVNLRWSKERRERNRKEKDDANTQLTDQTEFKFLIITIQLCVLIYFVVFIDGK